MAVQTGFILPCPFIGLTEVLQKAYRIKEGEKERRKEGKKERRK